MARARPDFVIPLAVAGVALSIGVPSWQRGQGRTGVACIALAIVALAWALIVARRPRR
jgi:hypothetical protein